MNPKTCVLMQLGIYRCSWYVLGRQKHTTHLAHHKPPHLQMLQTVCLPKKEKRSSYTALRTSLEQRSSSDKKICGGEEFCTVAGRSFNKIVALGRDDCIVMDLLR